MDSNVLLVVIGKKSKFLPIWQAFLKRKFQLIVSEDILHEYEEISLEHTNSTIASLVMEILLESLDVIYKRVYYDWNAISADVDDNKFFDVAVVANADFIVTNDNHFNEVKKLNFPIVNIITAQSFLEMVALL